MGIAVVAVPEVGRHLFDGGLLSLLDHFLVAALRTDLFIGRHENFELCVGENGGADVTAVHDDAAAGGESVELVVHPVSHEGNGTHGTYVLGDFPATDFLLYAAVSEEEHRGAVHLAEVQVQRADDSLDPGLIDLSVSDDAGFDAGQRHATVHGAAVQIQKTEFLSHQLGKSALAGGGIAVNGYDDVRNAHRKVIVKGTNIEYFCDICVKLYVMKVLIVDDERAIRYSLKEILEMENYQVDSAENGKEGLQKAEKEKYDAIFCDIKMPEMDGTEMLSKLIEEGIETPVIMVSGHADITTAVDCIKKGAFDFIEKPLDLNRILITLKNATDKANLVKETRILKKKVYGQEMVGGSMPVAHLKEMIEKVAPTQASVLITGPNGSGKELVAQGIYQLSTRSMMPFVEVNCAAIPSELIDSELFGHKKGSFTSAVRDHKGKFEQADGGTIFLDEIGDMSLAAQAKVLRVLQERKLTPVGGDKEITVDVRVIAATNKNLQLEIANGNFREDLYHRLSVIVLKVPALDDRKEDIPLLVNYFTERICSESGKPVTAFSEEALNLLQERSWPGNIRELRNVVERLLILGGNPVTAQDVKDYVM